MAELLLINPRSRRKAARKSTKAKRRPVARATAPARRRRRRNPAPLAAVQKRVMHRTRRAARHVRRRRNPISLGSSASWMTMLKEAAIGGAGAMAIEALMGQINPHLPASMQVSPTGVGAGDAVKAAITVVAGVLLSKPTKGLSKKMAQGALIVQAAEIARTFMPATLPMAGARLGYSSPARIVNTNARIGPNRLNAYVPGNTPLLNAYSPALARTPLLNGARQREGAVL